MARKFVVHAAGLLALGALLAPAAGADTRKMGSELALAYQGGVCTLNCLSLQQSQSGGALPNPIVSPANAVITGWKVRTSDDDALYSLRILRPTGTANEYRGAGTVEAPEAVPSGTEDAILGYPGENLPIRKGDSIGLYQSGNPDDGLPQAFTNGLTDNVIANNFGGLPADGDTASFIPDGQHELLLQATLKFCRVPGLKGRTAKAAKKALANADCGASVSKQETGKPKNVGKVIKQGKKPGFTAPPGTKIPIVVGK